MITLHIQLISKPEMRPDRAAHDIFAYMPRENSAEVDFDWNAGTVTVKLLQEELTDAQRDWLHMTPFAARYIDSYTIEEQPS